MAASEMKLVYYMKLLKALIMKSIIFGFNSIQIELFSTWPQRGGGKNFGGSGGAGGPRGELVNSSANENRQRNQLPFGGPWLEVMFRRLRSELGAIREGREEFCR